MRLSGRPTPGAANITAWVNIQVHFLSLSLQPKCKRESMELKRDVSSAKKKNKLPSVGVRWPQAIRRHGWWRRCWM